MNRKLLVAVVSGTLALPMAAQGVEIEASGHVNRALVFSGMSGAADTIHNDGSASGSRFRFQGSEDLGNGVTAGIHLEYGVADADNNPWLRHSSVNFSGGFGTLTLGHTAPATHLISYNTMDGYAWLSGVEVGCDFCKAAGGDNTVFTSFGPGRMGVVRYDTPSIGAATVSVSADGNDFWDIALRASGEMGGGITYSVHTGFTNYAAGKATPATNEFQGASPLELPALTDAKVKAEFGPDHRLESDAVGGRVVSHEVRNGKDEVVKEHYISEDNLHYLYTPGKPADPESKATTLSVAIGLAQGTHFEVTHGRSQPDGGSTSDFTHLGIGHNMENTSIAATYTMSDVGGGGDSWAIGVGHAIGSVELYAGYKYIDNDSALVEDYGIGVIGSRVKFN